MNKQNLEQVYRENVDEILGELKIDTMPENGDLKKYLNKTKIMYLMKGTILSIGLIGIIVSSIVNIAIDRNLTWSLIVSMGVLYLYAVGLTAVLSKTHKIVKMLAVLSILILPMLYGIEYVINMYYLSEPADWFGIYALPITVIWLVILWIIVLIKRFTNLNIWNVIGISLILSIFGSTLTDAIAQQLSLIKIYTVDFEWIDSISYLGCAIACFIIGYIRKDKCKY